MPLTEEQIAALTPEWKIAGAARKKWIAQARAGKQHGKQLPPIDLDWEILLMLAGRGWGKTASEVQWAWWEGWRVPNLVIHAVAPTMNDVRGTLFEGPAGFLATIPYELLLGGAQSTAYNKTLHELRLCNGTLFRGFGAVEEAGRLRGPQCHAMICDELREWDRPAGNLELAMDNALFGLRLPYPDGTPSRAVMGTTPKPIRYLKNFEKRPKVRVVRGTSYENLDNLASAYRTQIMTLAGTLIGKQEIMGLYIDEESDQSIIKRRWIRLWPLDKETGKPRKLPEFSMIIEVYDTASSEENFDKKRQTTDPTASIVLGVFNVAQCFTEEERKKFNVRCKYAALLLNCWSERLGLPELLDKAREQHRTLWGPKGKGRRSNLVLIEDKSSGPGLRQFLARWGIPAWPYNPKVGKRARASNISPLIMQGMFWVPESGRKDRKGQEVDWATEMLEQVCAFFGEGTTEFDDYVDCLTSGFAHLQSIGVLEAAPEIKFIDAEEKKEHEEREALRISRREQDRVAVNPYAA